MGQDKEYAVRTRIGIKVHGLLEHYFPERRVFLKSDNDTRFIRLKPHTQLLAFAGSSFLVAWAIVATAILLMDSIGAGNFREQAKREQQTYMERRVWTTCPANATAAPKRRWQRRKGSTPPSARFP